MRLLLATTVGIFGCYALAFSLGQVVAARDPARAHRLVPGDGLIAARLAALIAGVEASASDRLRADALARAALRRDPTAVDAVATLGLDAQVRGDTAAARRLFAYAQRLSRRNLTTHLWMIEDAVARGSMDQALRQYDIALRVRPSMGEVLFPVLASAAGDGAIRAALLRMLATRPPWGERFIAHMATSAPDPRMAATLLVRLRRARVPVPAFADAAMVDALLTAGAIDQAWSYYAAVRGGVDRRVARDLRIGGVATPSQLDWKASEGDGVAATIQDGAVDINVPPSTGGVVISQMQILPPGDYRLVGHSEGIEQADDASPYWRLTCRDQRELERVKVTNSHLDGGMFSGMFRVPATGCMVQVLALVARPSDAASGVSGRIDRVVLAPAG